MARRIIVNGEDLDLIHSNKIAFNLRVASLADISTRNSSSSNSILIPRTGKNQRLLGMTGTMGNNSLVPYSSLRCDYIIQGTYIVVDGYLQIIETLEDSYRIAIYDGIIDFAGLLGNKVISDLDFSPENHILDFATVEASFGNLSGYIYAMGDFDKQELLNPNDMDSHGVSVFAHTIWDRIFTEAGLTYTGAFFSTADWKELVLPATRGITLVDSGATETDIGTSNTDILSDNTDYGTYVVKNWQHTFSVDGYDANVTIDGGGDLQINYTGTMNFNYAVDYTLVDATRLRWVLKLNGATKVLFDLPTASTGTQTGSVTIEVTSGDIVSIHLISDTLTPSGAPPAGYFTHEFTSDTSLQIDTVSGGTLISVQDYMSTELKQKDFVKDILQRYGLIMLRERENPNEYRFISMESLLEDRTNNRDWTDKLTKIRGERYQSGYAQNNLADYAYASGVVPYLTGTLAVANDNAPYEATIINAPYEVPELSTYSLSNIRLYKIPIWEYDEDTVDYVNVETAPRLMRLKYDANDVGFKIFGSATTTVTVDIPFLGLDNMSYQYFFDNYYANLKAMLDTYKELTVTLDLDIVDFKRVDFGKLIYFRQTGRYYYIDTVKLQENGATAKLIEIKSFTS
jgi:hypothetical protein